MFTSEVSSHDVNTASTAASGVRILTRSEVLHVFRVGLNEATHLECTSNVHFNLATPETSEMTVTSAAVLHRCVEAAIWVVAHLSTGEVVTIARSTPTVTTVRGTWGTKTVALCKKV